MGQIKEQLKDWGALTIGLVALLAIVTILGLLFAVIAMVESLFGLGAAILVGLLFLWAAYLVPD